MPKLVDCEDKGHTTKFNIDNAMPDPLLVQVAVQVGLYSNMYPGILPFSSSMTWLLRKYIQRTH